MARKDKGGKALVVREALRVFVQPEARCCFPTVPEFEAPRSEWIAHGHFAPLGNALHKLPFDNSLEVDLIPRGAIERADRSLPKS